MRRAAEKTAKYEAQHMTDVTKLNTQQKLNSKLQARVRPVIWLDKNLPASNGT